MAGNPYEPIRAGDQWEKISATFINDTMLMLDWWRRQMNQRAPSRPAPPNPGVILVQNNSNVDVDRFGVLGLDNSTPPIDPGQSADSFKQQVIVNGVTPDQTKHRLRFAVALDPIPQGKIGRCAVSGVVQVQVLLVANLNGVMVADVNGGDSTQLVQTPGGFRLDYLQSGNAGDTVWGYLHLGNPEGPLYAQMDSSQDGTHPLGAIRTYDLLPKGTPLITVPVVNQIASVQFDVRPQTAVIQGMAGQYSLLAVNPCAGGAS